MPDEKTLSFDEISSGIDKLNLADYQPGGRHHISADAAKANPAAVLPQLCTIYKAVKPILVGISNFPLIPQKWRDAIKTLITILDALCP